MKVVENTPQNARNCTIFKNFLGGGMSPNPLATARSFATRDMPLRGMYTQIPNILKLGPSLLRNPAYAPGKMDKPTNRKLNRFDFVSPTSTF